jgi:uncharacterized protein YigE (DUF2233 family)
MKRLSSQSYAPPQALCRLGILFLVVSLPVVAPSWAQEMAWDRLAEGLEATVWDPRSGCGEQVPLLILVKVDPQHFSFATFHYADEKLLAPLTIKEWQRRTGALVLFNAGLFKDDYSYMGWLYKNGRSLGSKRHPQWEGLFVAEPMAPDLKKAGVLDLAVDAFSADHPAYREAAQSIMLLDRTGKPRVRRTGKQAHQTVVAEDRDGRILLFKTADVVALWELAECLRDRFPSLLHAMAMDGGASSDLLIAAELPARPEGGTGPAWGLFHPLVNGSGMHHIPLPSVIGVLPRRGVTYRRAG